ncbi:REP-associated tyrosine transposase [Peribacillus tepidiphilus]|uniref:REP-associated tyrosine transposase n=1 Tax=Peribacillus tepidiphilus TaxID=2652445 RepID=UPI0035B534CF
MPRKKRIWIPHHFYHVVCRGNRRDPLFRCRNDYLAFFHILSQLHEKIPFEIASYCLMTNHFHLQIRSTEEPLSKVMSFINKRYANYYNTRYKLTGHVFEKRYYDKIITDREGMLEVSRYIHLNPVEAKMVKKPEDYPWSSYYFYKNPSTQKPQYVVPHKISTYFVGDEKEQYHRYCGFVENVDL